MGDQTIVQAIGGGCTSSILPHFLSVHISLFTSEKLADFKTNFLHFEIDVVRHCIAIPLSWFVNDIKHWNVILPKPVDYIMSI